MTYYAKSDQTYNEHLEAAYEAWKETIEFKKDIIYRLGEKYNFSPERFLKGSLLSVAFHDIGKMIDIFQTMVNSDNFDYRKNYRHELVSFIYILQYLGILNKEEQLLESLLEAIAVLGHHKKLDIKLQSFNREYKSGKLPNLIDEGIEEGIRLANDFFLRQGWKLPEIQTRFISPTQIANRLFPSGEISNKIQKDGEKRARLIYALIKGILHYADWHGSAGKPVNYCVDTKLETIKEKVIERCQKKKIQFIDYTDFQKKCGNIKENVLAIAPTGSGKTEASVLWALKNLNKRKIIYLLPTMVTTNKMYERMKVFFGKDNVGLCHSTANLFLEKEEEREEDRFLLFDKTFIKPVTVATVDQLLTIGFNSGHWTVKEINAANAVIIIDEIHSYDGWTLGLLIESIKHFSELGASFMLMSATMPTKLIELFIETLPDIKIIMDNSKAESQRSKYFVKDIAIENDIETIENAVKEGRKVLVVVNTVKQCQDLSKELNHLKPICYHSQFMFNHRQEKEQKIPEANFVIATQVVEVSLDIDFDWLFTECAPPDAIAQRAGRVNRYRDPKRDSRVYIYKPSDKSGKIYNPINDFDRLDRSFEEFKKVPSNMTEKDLGNVIESIYKEYDFTESEDYKDAIEIYKISQKNRLGILDVSEEAGEEKTRRSKYEKISVIPLCYRDKALEEKPYRRRLYEVKIPLWYYQKHKREYDNIMFCQIEYDERFGAVIC